MVSFGMVGFGSVRQARLGLTRYGEVGPGGAGKVRFVQLGKGEFRLGRRGMDRYGKVRSVAAGRGKAGTVWCVSAC